MTSIRQKILEIRTAGLQLADSIRGLEKIRESKISGARIYVGSAREKTGRDDEGEGEQLELGDSYILDLYHETAEQARSRFGIKTPHLRILRGMHPYKGGYLGKSDTIHVGNVNTKPGLRITLLHELSHAVAKKKYGEDGHGYYFLQVYKVLTGRDYFENQDKLIRKLRQK